MPMMIESRTPIPRSSPASRSRRTELDVLWARINRVTGVIVCDDERRRITQDCRFESLPDVDDRRREAADRDDIHADGVVLRIEHENEEVFMIEFGEQRAQKLGCFRRLPYGGAR
jgi:hypothetical protein